MICFETYVLRAFFKMTIEVVEKSNNGKLFHIRGAKFAIALSQNFFCLRTHVQNIESDLRLRVKQLISMSSLRYFDARPYMHF